MEQKKQQYGQQKKQQYGQQKQQQYGQQKQQQIQQYGQQKNQQEQEQSTEMLMQYLLELTELQKEVSACHAHIKEIQSFMQKTEATANQYQEWIFNLDKRKQYIEQQQEKWQLLLQKTLDNETDLPFSIRDDMTKEASQSIKSRETIKKIEKEIEKKQQEEIPWGKEQKQQQIQQYGQQKNQQKQEQSMEMLMQYLSELTELQKEVSACRLQTKVMQSFMRKTEATANQYKEWIFNLDKRKQYIEQQQEKWQLLLQKTLDNDTDLPFSIRDDMTKEASQSIKSRETIKKIEKEIAKKQQEEIPWGKEQKQQQIQQYKQLQQQYEQNQQKKATRSNTTGKPTRTATIFTTTATDTDTAKPW